MIFQGGGGAVTPLGPHMDSPFHTCTAFIYFCHVFWIKIDSSVILVLTGADSGFLERGFICIKVLGFAHLIKKSHVNEMIWFH